MLLEVIKGSSDVKRQEVHTKVVPSRSRAVQSSPGTEL